MRYEIIEQYADNGLLMELPVSPQIRAANLMQP